MVKMIVLITGGTSGIGKSAAIGLARLGLHAIIHGRCEKKALQLQQEIISKTNNENVDVLIADFYRQSDLRALVNDFNTKYRHLDVLINNAGVIKGRKRQETVDGIESTIALNLLAPFLLTNLLIEQLKKSKAGRVFNVASSAHSSIARPDFKDMDMTMDYHPGKAYGNSKLYLIWITQYLAKKIRTEGLNTVTVNSMHPGNINSNFSVGSDFGFLLNFFGKVVRQFFDNPDQGADTLIYIATTSKLSLINGSYFINRKIAESAKTYYSQENEELIWNYCKKRTGFK